MARGLPPGQPRARTKGRPIIIMNGPDLLPPHCPPAAGPGPRVFGRGPFHFQQSMARSTPRARLRASRSTKWPLKPRTKHLYVFFAWAAQNPQPPVPQNQFVSLFFLLLCFSSSASCSTKKEKLFLLVSLPFHTLQVRIYSHMPYKLKDFFFPKSQSPVPQKTAKNIPSNAVQT